MMEIANLVLIIETYFHVIFFAHGWYQTKVSLCRYGDHSLLQNGFMVLRWNSKINGKNSFWKRTKFVPKDNITLRPLPNQKNIYGAALALIAIMYGIMQGIIGVPSLLATMALYGNGRDPQWCKSGIHNMYYSYHWSPIDQSTIYL